MICVKLQYSVLCEGVKKASLVNIIHGFTKGPVRSFYVVNKWVWDDLDGLEDGFYQITELIKEDKVVAYSQSKQFMVKLSHTHQNYFKDIVFTDGSYRIRILLYNRKGELIEAGSTEYPVIVR